MERITSAQNPRVKLAAKLRDRRARQQQGRFPIDGARELRRALESGVRPDETFVCFESCQGADAQVALDWLQRHGCRLIEVTPEVLAKLAYGDRNDGIVAIAKTWAPALAEIVVPQSPIVAVLEGVEKPGNVGAVLRSADAAGVAALVLANGGTDLFNPNTVRASLGTIFTVPVCVASSRETLAWLRANKWNILAARVDGARDYTLADFSQPTAIVLGSEARGLTDVWSAPNVTAIRLPMHGRADSLNVSATAAVLFYEALRQRNSGKSKTEN